MATKLFATKYDKIDGTKFQQKFDQDVTFKRKGKTVKINDYVQENAVGTDFYKNLEQFGNIETVIDFMSVNKQEIIADFQNTVTLVDLEERRNKTKELFYRLPPQIRDKFGNKFDNFMNNAELFITDLKNNNERKSYAKTTENNGAVPNSQGKTTEQTKPNE